MGAFKQKPYESVSVGNGAFIADFYVDEKKADIEHNYLHLHTPNRVFDMRVIGYPFGYLLAALKQGKEEEIHSFCVLLWRMTQEIYQDGALANDIVKAFIKRDRRLMREAERGAKAITPEQEQADAAFMQEVIKYAEASPKEREKMRKADRELIKEVLNEERQAHGEPISDNR